MRDKGPGSTWWLAAGSALLTSFTFKLPDWTGIRISREWPIGAAILLMIGWGVAHRRHGLSIASLLANILGIATGILVSKIVRMIELGKAFNWTSAALSLIMPGVLLVLVLKVQARERAQAIELGALDLEFERIKTLPPEERARAFEERLAALNAEANTAVAWAGKLCAFGWIANMLVAVAIVLVITTFSTALRPEPKPLLILVNIAILGGGVAYFAMAIKARRMAAHESKENPEQGHEL